MRVFFAIGPDPETALQIADWRDRQFSHPARPVPVANFHLTLAFAGELPAESVEALCQATEQWLAGRPPAGASLTLDQTGYWPGPGIYWLGPSRWPPSLDSLAGKLRRLVVSAGARRERKRFQPHITLFRRCQSAPPMPARAPDFSLVYRHFALYESRQLRDGVAYDALAEWPLPPP